jgi:hypothetical protein
VFIKIQNQPSRYGEVVRKVVERAGDGRKKVELTTIKDVGDTLVAKGNSNRIRDPRRGVVGISNIRRERGAWSGWRPGLVLIDDVPGGYHHGGIIPRGT